MAQEPVRGLLSLRFADVPVSPGRVETLEAPVFSPAHLLVRLEKKPEYYFTFPKDGAPSKIKITLTTYLFRPLE